MGENPEFFPKAFAPSHPATVAEREHEPSGDSVTRPPPADLGAGPVSTGPAFRTARIAGAPALHDGRPRAAEST